MRKALAALFIVVLLGVSWTAAWFYAASAAGRGLDDWRHAEAAQGRSWTCPNRAIGGYPFAITIDCSDATFVGQAKGQGVEGSIAHLKADVSLAHPRSLLVSLVAPFAYKTSDGTTTVTATWTHLEVAMTPLPHPAALALHGSDVAVEGVFGASGPQGGKAARLDVALAPVSDQPAPAIDIAVAIAGTNVPVLDDLMGGTDPVSFDLAGRVNRAIARSAHTPEEMIDLWRQDGGSFDITQATILRGTSKVKASGTLRLDDAHRPKGHLDAQFIGLEPILQRFGISGNLAAAGSLLSTLFGGPRQAAPTEPGALALPISLQNGRLAIGPLQTEVSVPPLY